MMIDTHEPECPALDPFAHLLGDYGDCTCDLPAAAPYSGPDAAIEWLNMIGRRDWRAVDDGDYPI